MPYSEYHRKEKEKERYLRRREKFLLWAKTHRKYTYQKKGYNLSSAAKKGAKHPLWKGGGTRERNKVMHSLKYKQWRSGVFQRDNWTCQTCKKRGDYLEAHHIKRWVEYPELRFNIDNGVTLCKECHKLITYRRKK